MCACSCMSLCECVTEYFIYIYKVNRSRASTYYIHLCASFPQFHDTLICPPHLCVYNSCVVCVFPPEIPIFFFSMKTSRGGSFGAYNRRIELLRPRGTEKRMKPRKTIKRRLLSALFFPPSFLASFFLS